MCDCESMFTWGDWKKRLEGGRQIAFSKRLMDVEPN